MNYLSGFNVSYPTPLLTELPLTLLVKIGGGAVANKE
jgi:hypothetical protein